MHWLLALIFGILLTVLGVYLSIEPAIFTSFCIEPPCKVGMLFSGALFAIGVALIITAIIFWRRQHTTQTVTIALGESAEEDAAVLEQLQSAVSHHENPDKVVPKHAQKTVSENKFIQLPKEERKLRRVKR